MEMQRRADSSKRWSGASQLGCARLQYLGPIGPTVEVVSRLSCDRCNRLLIGSWCCDVSVNQGILLIFSIFWILWPLHFYDVTLFHAFFLWEIDSTSLLTYFPSSSESTPVGRLDVRGGQRCRCDQDITLLERAQEHELFTSRSHLII
jgi:hypothetical protein